MRRGSARAVTLSAQPIEEADRPDRVVLTDLSANIFAALLLVLLMLMQFEAQPRQPASGLDAAPAPVARLRHPLAPAALVDLLFARGAGSELSVDLGDTRMVIAPGTDRPLDLAEGLRALERSLASGEARPMHLFVFSNRSYAPLAAFLDARGQAWTELSVPGALRDPADPDRWSPAFLALVHGRDAAAFRIGLATLLAGGPADRPDGRVTAQGRGMAPPQGAPGGAPLDGLDRLLVWLKTVGILTVLTLGFGTVVLVERLVPARRLG